MWDWNLSSITIGCWLIIILIAPMWDWNNWIGAKTKRLCNSNCTNVGLKSYPKRFPTLYDFILIAPMWDWNYLIQIEPFSNPYSNCTNVGLKSRNWRGNPTLVHSNCTNVGLKSTYFFFLQDCFPILIAPMWDWNSKRCHYRRCAKSHSNCTNVGLKCIWVKRSYSTQDVILIAPMWDWNSWIRAP